MLMIDHDWSHISYHMIYLSEEPKYAIKKP